MKGEREMRTRKSRHRGNNGHMEKQHCKTDARRRMRKNAQSPLFSPRAALQRALEFQAMALPTEQRFGGPGDMPSRVCAPHFSTPLKAPRTLNFPRKLPEPWCVPS